MFVCPTLMTGEWRKSLGKIADFMFTFAAGSSVWETTMFEPLAFCFVAPLLDSRPWKMSGIWKMEKWKQQVSELQWGDPGILWRHLRKFWNEEKRSSYNL